MAHLEIIRPVRESWWQRAKRSITLGPWNPRDREIARYFGGTPVTSGVSVNEDNAMSFSAVWAAVNLVSAHISSVPLVLYRVGADGGKTRYTNHQLYRLLHDRPNPLMGSALVRRAVQSQKMIWGEGFAEIERDAAGRPVNIWPLLTYRMHAFFEGNKLYYRYSNPSGRDVIFEPQDVLHIRAHTDNGINGVGMVRIGRESFGVAIAAERHAAALYGNGMTMAGTITYPPGINLTPQAKEDNRRALENRHQGVDRAYRLLTLYEGGKYEQLGVSPNEGQFLESRMFQVEEVARWTNVPPHKLKHLQRTSYNSIEHQSIEYVTDALDPDWVLWEQELNLKLVSPLEMNQQRIEHIREGMLRGDSTSRSELQSKQFSIGGITSNEVRAMENRNPVNGGDVPFVALNMIPMDLARPYWEAQIKKAETPPPAPVAPKKDDGEADRAIEELKEQLAIERDRASKAEERADLRAAEAIQAQMALELAQRDQKVAEDALAVANTSLHDAASRVFGLEEGNRLYQSERDGALAKIEAWTVRGAELEAEIDRWKGTAAAEATVANDAMKTTEKAEAERDAALALAEEAQKERDEARAESEESRKRVSLAEVSEAQALRRAEASDALLKSTYDINATLTAEAESLRTDLARARDDLATELETQRKQKAVTLAAMRSLFVDASERLLQKESDRARKHQATAEKLRAWVDTFYPMHEETVRSAFRPLVGAWVSVAGGDSRELLERLVTEHMATSRQAFMHILDADDEDMRAALLERTLRRWEEERAEAMADALVREGMSNG